MVKLAQSLEYLGSFCVNDTIVVEADAGEQLRISREGLANGRTDAQVELVVYQDEALRYYSVQYG